MTPYRDPPYVPEPEDGPKSIREVYEAAVAAVAYFNRSCPHGLVIEPRRATDWPPELVVKHGPRFLISYGSLEVTFCCQEKWDDLWRGRYLPIPWRWLWKRRVKKLDPSMFRETPLARPR